MKKKTKRFVLDCEIYSANIYVSVGGTYKSATEWWFRKAKISGKPNIENDDDTEKRVGCVSTVDTHMGCMIWFYATPGVGTLSHECLHATCRILGHAHLPLTRESEEAYTYLLAWMTREIGLKLWRRKKR